MKPLTALITLSEHPCFGGVQGYYQHESVVCAGPMRFSVFVPPQARVGPVPVLYLLAGLSCNEETFPFKAGAQLHAARLGLMLVSPDTSPRHTDIEAADANWQFGTGASFYLDAQVAPWRQHWQMATYVTQELREGVVQAFAACPDRAGICGHSMGGHGALSLALTHPGLYQSVSALAPMASMMQCAWGLQALRGYLGPDPVAWAQVDVVELLRAGARVPPLLIDQGLADTYMADQLKPHLLEEACRAAGQPLILRRHERYDHGYHFVSTFMADHIEHHAQRMKSGT